MWLTAEGTPFSKVSLPPHCLKEAESKPVRQSDRKRSYKDPGSKCNRKVRTSYISGGLQGTLSPRFSSNCPMSSWDPVCASTFAWLVQHYRHVQWLPADERCSQHPPFSVPLLMAIPSPGISSSSFHSFLLKSSPYFKVPAIPSRAFLPLSRCHLRSVSPQSCS